MPRAASYAAIAGALLVSLASSAAAQDGKSVALARALAAAMDAAKLDSIAAKDPSSPDTFAAALYFPGAQLLVVSAKYTAPQLLDARLSKKEYRDTYIDLNSASVPETKIFIQDAGADGMKAKREENQAYDSYEAGGKPFVFDGDWKRQKMSEQEYMKAFTSADERYSQILTALIAQTKKPS
jgi:hypothetical protein